MKKKIALIVVFVLLTAAIMAIGDIEGYDYPTLRLQKDEEPDEPDEPKGCGSAIGAGTGVMCVALLLGACVTTKKRK